MNQDEFLAKLFSLYAATFSRGNGQAWSEVYKKVLNPNLDYDKLYDYLIFEYTDAGAPKPAHLLKHAVYKKSLEPEQSEETETLIVRNSNYEYEYGVKLADYENDIKYFNRNGFSILKLKFCDKECPRCNYNGVCLTARQGA